MSNTIKSLTIKSLAVKPILQYVTNSLNLNRLTCTLLTLDHLTALTNCIHPNFYSCYRIVLSKFLSLSQALRPMYHISYPCTVHSNSEFCLRWKTSWFCVAYGSKPTPCTVCEAFVSVVHTQHGISQHKRNSLQHKVTAYYSHLVQESEILLSRSSGGASILCKLVLNLEGNDGTSKGWLEGNQDLKEPIEIVFHCMQVGGVGTPEFHPGVVEEPSGRERDTIFNNIQSIRGLQSTTGQEVSATKLLVLNHLWLQSIRWNWNSWLCDSGRRGTYHVIHTLWLQ